MQKLRNKKPDTNQKAPTTKQQEARSKTNNKQEAKSKMQATRSEM